MRTLNLGVFAIYCSMTGLARTLPTSSAPEAPDATLRRRGIELRVFGGISAGSGRGPLTPKTPPPSLGAEGAVGLNRYVAVIDGYTYNGLGQYQAPRCVTVTSHPSSVVTTCSSPGIVRARIHQLLGGCSLSAPIRNWVTPCSAFAVGAVRASASAAAAGVNPLSIEGTGLSEMTVPAQP